MDVQRKTAHDTVEQFHRQFGHPGGFASQQMHQYPAQYGYNVSVHLAPAAAGHAGASGSMGGAQPGVIAGSQAAAGGRAALAITHNNQGPAGVAGN